MFSSLKANPDSIHYQDKNGNTILHHIPLNIRIDRVGWAKLVKSFITKESLLIANNKGNLPIDIAIAYVEISRCRYFVKILLKKSDNFGIKYEDHIDLKKRIHPLHMLIRSHRDMAWGFGNNYDTVEFFKTCCPNTFNPNIVYIDSEGKEITPLVLAFLLYHIEEAETLLKNNADIKIGSCKEIIEHTLDLIKEKNSDDYTVLSNKLVHIQKEYFSVV